MTNPIFRPGTIGALVLQLLVAAIAGGTPPIALPGCPASCGNLSVPYPFGIGEGCSYKGFNLTCDETRHPAKLLLGDGLEVLDFDLDGLVRINSKVFLSESPEFSGTWSALPTTGPFKVSNTDNWFVALGCNILAQLSPQNPPLGSGNYTSSCAAMCVDDLNDEVSSSCSGIGRCRASIRLPVPSYFINVTRLVLHESTATDSPRSTGYLGMFIVEKAWFSTYGGDINLDPRQRFVLRTVPVVLEWSLDSNWTCIGSNSFLYGDPFLTVLETGTNCFCSDGYRGNPYLANGCQGLITIIAISAGFGLLFSLLGFRDNRLSDILDPQIVEEGGTEDAVVVARLAEACLSLKGEERPTMRQVETTLEDVQGSKVNSKLSRTRQNAPNDQSYTGCKSGDGTRQYSLEKEFIQSSEFPR
ncbi:hypothetical protein EJB05_39944, partial [Eragrostis curvula]